MTGGRERARHSARESACSIEECDLQKLSRALAIGLAQLWRRQHPQHSQDRQVGPPRDTAPEQRAE